MPIAFAARSRRVALTRAPLATEDTSGLLPGMVDEGAVLWSLDDASLRSILVGDASVAELWAAAFGRDDILWLATATERDDDTSALEIRLHRDDDVVDILTARHGPAFEHEGWGFARVTAFEGAAVLSVGSCGASTEHLHVLVAAEADGLVERARLSERGSRFLGRDASGALRVASERGIVSLDGSAATIEPPLRSSRFALLDGQILAIHDRSASIHDGDAWQSVELADVAPSNAKVLPPWSTPTAVRTPDGDALLVTRTTDEGLEVTLLALC